MWFQRRDERYVDEVKLLNGLDQLDSQQTKEAQSHLAFCFLNAASVLMQQGHFQDAVYSCTKALEFDPRSAKGHFRRAQAGPPWKNSSMWGRECLEMFSMLLCCMQANYALDSTHHLELAVKDLRQAAVLSPSDARVRACLNEWKQELMLQNAKDRRTFKKIFSGESLYVDENSNSLGLSSHPLWYE